MITIQSMKEKYRSKPVWGWSAIVLIGLWIGGLSVAATVSAENLESNLSVHGYLTQAYANSHGGQILGIPDDGTTDYRTAALQFRYKMPGDDTFVLQLSHERIGKSVLQTVKPDVHMDWVYYQHQLLDSVVVKIGKIPIPHGIYNEVLDVGTILPFYRPPSQMYGESAFSSETVDGAEISHTLQIGDWELRTDIYGGEWDFDYIIDGVITPVRSKNALGGQLWLQTPMEGVRVGVGGYRSTDSGVPLLAPGAKMTRMDWRASFDADLEHFVVQAEYMYSDSKTDKFDAYYLLAGIKLFNKLRLNGMVEIADLDLPGFKDNISLSKDYAVGVNYAFRPNVVVKVEQHWLKTLNIEDPVAHIDGDPVRAQYYIVSLSTSF
ncbi:MAG: hypothetical protein HY282_18850 [Nitrospirae bacterium]|nr:hypothetical protein [Candidatus Manganitrophaceae bacterium]